MGTWSSGPLDSPQKTSRLNRILPLAPTPSILFRIQITTDNKDVGDKLAGGGALLAGRGQAARVHSWKQLSMLCASCPAGTVPLPPHPTCSVKEGLTWWCEPNLLSFQGGLCASVPGPAVLEDICLLGAALPPPGTRTCVQLSVVVTSTPHPPANLPLGHVLT